jgi:hypothetical protein
MRRRDLIAGAALLAAGRPAVAQPEPWDAGGVLHILPTVSHDRALLKVSLLEPQHRAPVLILDGLRVFGERQDLVGTCWTFDAEGLQPAWDYRLTLVDSDDKPLCDPWSLSTFPAPGDRPRRLRVLFYTCAGGNDLLGRQLPMAIRTRLLDRALSFAPDVLVANGDHVYRDLRSRARAAYGAHPRAIAEVGEFAREGAVLDGGHNEAVLKRAVAPQIVPLYGTRCRSIPTFFLQDDHDYFDNDEADDRLITFPPDPFMRAASRATQRLYYPEFLPDAARPLGLGGTRVDGVSQNFGTLRYGRLLEVLLYDCRRWMALHGPTGSFVPQTTEDWLLRRMAEGETAHLINAPSTPPGWSAGKWAEWYADLEADGRLTTTRPKPYWQPGWRAQHDRLLAAASARRDRIPLFISGDLHASGETRIARTGTVDLSANPVVSVLSGTLGTAGAGWSSAFRGMVPKTPGGLVVDETFPAREENGFTIVDVTPEDMTLRYFTWRHAAPEAIDTLDPVRTTRLARA